MGQRIVWDNIMSSMFGKASRIGRAVLVYQEFDFGLVEATGDTLYVGGGE